MAITDDARAGRVAIVVVGGIGGGPKGAAGQRLVGGLLRDAGDSVRPGVETVEWFASRARFGVPETTESVSRLSLEGRAGCRDVDVYEMWWSDLSRFPGSLVSYATSLFSLLLNATALGRAAYLDDRPIRAEPASSDRETKEISRKNRLIRGTLGAIEWLVALPLVSLLLTMLALAGAGAIALALPTATVWLVPLVLAPYGAALTALGVYWAATRYREHRWGAAAVLGTTAALTIGLVAWRLVHHQGVHGDAAIADAVLLLTAYGVRPLWLLAASLMIALGIGVCIHAVALRAREAGTVTRDLQRAKTAVLSMVGPLGFALLSTIVLAALLAVFHPAGKQLSWTRDAGSVWCLPSGGAWVREDCATANLPPYDWLVRLFSQTVMPLITIAGLLVIGLVALVVAVLIARPGDRRPENHGAIVSRVLTVVDWWNNTSVRVATPLTGLLVVACAVPPLVWWVWPRPSLAVNGTLAEVVGLLVTGLSSVAGVLGLSWQRVKQGKAAPETVRRIINAVYDVIAYLREPSRAPSWVSQRSHQEPLPRQRILARYAGLVDHITGGGSDGRRYETLIIFAHSHGAVLSTALLAETAPRPGNEKDVVILPRELRVALVTSGTPLLHLYAARFPYQFQWITDLHAQLERGETLDDVMRSEDGFVRGVTDAWINYGALQDPVGITLFYPAFERDPSGKNTPFPGYCYPSRQSRMRDVCIGDGGHDSYWTSERVYRDLREMIRR